MNDACGTPLSVETLVAYWLGELSGAEAAQVEQHYFACARCSGRLEGITRLGDGVVELVRRGRVSASVTQKLVELGVARGLRVRRYRVEPGQEVACTAAPSDDFVALHLVVPGALLGDDDVVDVAVEWTAIESGVRQKHTLTDITYDRAAGELVLLSAGRDIREFPKSEWHWTAVLRGASGETRLGPYTLNHTPWDQLTQPL